MRKILSFTVKAFCIFAIMFGLSTTYCLGSNGGGNGGSDGNKDESKNKGNTIPPIIILPPPPPPIS